MPLVFKIYNTEVESQLKRKLRSLCLIVEESIMKDMIIRVNLGNSTSYLQD